MPFPLDAGRIPTDAGIGPTDGLPKRPRLASLPPPDTGPATDAAGAHQRAAASVDGRSDNGATIAAV